MAGSLLVPISVSAKVVGSPTDVPLLTDAPLKKTGTLEPGIHVHWALPDALTRARLVPGSKSALFPGVPDLWAIVRFNPAPKLLGQKRGWRAWVLDSQTGAVKNLVGWTPPTARAPDALHAAPGMLRRSPDVAAWGVWDEAQGDFDPLTIAYYPACRTRLGFWDSLSDLAGQEGTVNYTVIGWYSSLTFDPLNQAPDRAKLLDEWKLSHHEEASLYDELSATVATASSTPAPWMPSGIGMVKGVMPTAAQVQDIKRAAARGDGQTARKQALSRMQAGFPQPTVSRTAPAQGVVEALRQYRGPTSLVCHGAVTGVQLAGWKAAKDTIGSVKVYPSIKRAMADIASNGASDDAQVDMVEMLLQDLDHQKGTAAGILDLPGAAHALNFQSVPGKSVRYARLDVYAKPPAPFGRTYFDIDPSPYGDAVPVSGHWPPVADRIASVDDEPKPSAIPAAARYDAGPGEPDREEIEAWIDAVLAAHDACVAAAPDDAPVHPELIRVHDRRPNAHSGQLGRSADGSGSDSAVWLVSRHDRAALAELRRAIAGHSVYLPHSKNVYEEPGPRWYRPWSPQVVVTGAGRSQRFGLDGRYREDGYVDCRRSGEVLMGIAVGASGMAHGRDVATDLTPLAIAGVPAEVRGLAAESVLLDPESAGVMAGLVTAATDKPDTRALVTEQFRSAVRGIYTMRDPVRKLELETVLDAVLPFGSLPSPIASTPWEDPRDPLFLDANYSHPRWPVEQDWTLEPEHVEPTRRDPLVTQAPAVEVIEERTPVTATIAKVLTSALFTKTTLDAYGNPVPVSNPPENVDPKTYEQADIVSAPLTKFDATMFARGLRERSGALRVNRVRVVDVFGVSRDWSSGVDPTSATADMGKPWWTELSPRLPFWGRLRFRLQAPAGDAEATPAEPAVCGVLVPDFVEHTLEVFDGQGRALGQLASDAPRVGPAAQDVTLQVKFTLHPWVRAAHGLTEDDDPFPVIENGTLRALVRSIAAQSLTVPAGSDGARWNETGLTALLRVIDTIRGTLDPSVKARDRRVALLGDPILVLRARFELEGTGTDDLKQLAGDPPKLDAPPELPAFPLRIGDVTRPDDGVLGCFIAGGSDAEGRFAPVSKEAADGAIFNVFSGYLSDEFQVDPAKGLAATHPFVSEATTTFQVPPNDPQTYVILADPRGALYATCGVLPRKKIVIPKEFIDAALRDVEPTFAAGPLLATEQLGAVKVMVPPPQVEGHVTKFVSEAEADVFAEAAVSPVAPLGDLPKTRVTLTDGWMRVHKAAQG